MRRVACNKLLTATSGRIVSPGWPGRYPQNANCVVRIVTPAGNKISMFFAVFSIERHSGCNLDYLQVRSNYHLSMVRTYIYRPEIMASPIVWSCFLRYRPFPWYSPGCGSGGKKGF